MRQSIQSKKKRKPKAKPLPDVLTLTETARFLRLPAKEIAKLAEEQGLPGRRIGNEWRFLRAAVEEWLKGLGRNGAKLTYRAGAFKDEPDFDKFMESVRKQREQLNAELR